MKQKTKQELQVEQQVLYNLSQVTEAFPQYTIAQHIWHFLRTKGEAPEPYKWTNEFLLNRLEAYYDELKSDLLVNTENDEY